jgi:hypothetical protein
VPGQQLSGFAEPGKIDCDIVSTLKKKEEGFSLFLFLQMFSIVDD